ncbi:MAG: aldehyde dehydrogenase family protein [Dehalococcoidia bacterium]|nr:aldehyde dehydrogenase family protein [Dehalococcoidia bacterium]
MAAPAIPSLDVPALIPANSHYIGGQWVRGSTDETIDVINPATREVLQRVARGREADIDLAVRTAHAAFPQWRDMNPTTRGNLLRKWADLLNQHGHELSLLGSLEVGRPFRGGGGGEGAAGRLPYYASQADKITGDTLPVTRPDVLAFTLREPFGVCGVIVPWNGPLGMMLNGGAAALAAGNTIVVKPAEDAPLACLLAISLAKEAGIPDGVVNIVSGYGPEAGAALPVHPLVRHMSFTGSPESGQKVMEGCAKNLIPLHLELGGKSPQIILKDADLSKVIPLISSNIIANTGQICYAGTRIVVEDSVRPLVVEGVAERLEKVRVGPWYEDVQMGPLINEKQENRVVTYMNLGQEEGAKLVTGGHKLSGDVYDRGFFVEPTLFDEVKSDMRIAQEEIFGPVLSVMGFTDAEEAIEIANGTKYGLAASVWTNDIRRAQMIVRKLQAGQVYVNTYGHSGVIGAPFGGYKNSGFGRTGGFDTIMQYLQVKSVIMDAGEGGRGRGGE